MTTDAQPAPTDDEILDEARAAGIDWHKHWNDDGTNRLEIFARAVRAKFGNQPAGAVPLTDEQIDEIHLANSDAYERGDVEYESHGFARAVEEHHGIKGG